MRGATAARFTPNLNAVASTRLFADQIMKQLYIPCDPGEISDGYHTFNELYEHRCTLFLALMSCFPDRSWIAKRHHDMSEWDGWFIAGMDLETGPITYHLPDSMLLDAQNTGAKFLDEGKEWDGHTAADVVTRLRKWVNSANAEVSRPAATDSATKQPRPDGRLD